MFLPKKSGADWHADYALHLKLGAILSLSLLVLAASLNVYTPTRFPDDPPPPEIVTMADVKPTEQRTTPPPPAAPPVPVEVPNDAIVDAAAPDFDAELILDATNPTMPPPSDVSEKKEPDFFVAVEHPPQIKGGMQALYDAVTYPASARRAGVEGRVIVQFVVHEDGSVRDARVLQSVHPLLDREAVNAVRSLRFEPGRQRGRAVRVQMSLPVHFQLQ